MLIAVLIEIDETNHDADRGTLGDEPDVVAEGVLARVADECGYTDTGLPYTPTGPITVHIIRPYHEGLVVSELDKMAAHSARGHGPL